MFFFLAFPLYLYLHGTSTFECETFYLEEKSAFMNKELDPQKCIP